MTGLDAAVVVVGATVVVDSGSTVVVAGTEVVLVGSDGPFAVELVATVADAAAEPVDVTVLEEVELEVAEEAVVAGSAAVGLAVSVDADVETAACPMPTA